MTPDRSLCETLVSEALDAELAAFDSRLPVARTALHEAEAADRIALHLSRVVERALASVDKSKRVALGTALARRLVEAVVEATSATALLDERLVEPSSVLRSIGTRAPDGSVVHPTAPLLPLLDTALLTNAPGEPRVGSQVLTEIDSADRIDVVMAFIRRSGISPMLDALRRHTEAGRKLRVLTTTYTGSTEARALDELIKAGADVRVSYDQSTTRLHAKAWLFHRDAGFSTAYIGSSNLTHSAQVSGLEWNVRASRARNPSVVEKVAAVFESYWNSGDFVPYERGEFERQLAEAGGGERRVQIVMSAVEVRPEPFQERLLEQIALARSRGEHRNLLVSATGTGKTVMAALDYARLRATLPRARLLFVAHREEILFQSLATFRHVLREPAFGELWVGGARPKQFEHVFASVQSLSATGLSHIKPDDFDVVIVDEFHHAAASSYRALLDRVTPVELLGLTATPERSDGLPILDWFNGGIAAELRLWDAIDQHRLVPFAYYGVHDGLDLTSVPWKRGTGYDVEGLTNLLTSNDAWVRIVLKELGKRVDDLGQMRALGFCVSVDHARFMARRFAEAGVPAVAIWANTPDEERRQALRDLAMRKVNVVFSVDLFNEGVDVPEVDTLLMLRPTDSATLFLQQLGRGLRRHPAKAQCTVLDFVGQHHKDFRFDRRLRALLGGTRGDLVRQIEGGFPYLPAGCHFELDAVAQEIVLRNVKGAIPSRWADKVSELKALARLGAEPTLSDFLAECGLELEELYAQTKSWSDLCEDAGLPVAAAGPHEESLRRACGRLLHVDDLERLEAYRAFTASPSPPDVGALPERDRRRVRMLVAQLADKVLEREASLAEACALVWAHPQVLRELTQLFDALRSRVSHVPVPLATHPESPLVVHAQYTRIEILAGLGIAAERGAKVAAWQAGVYFAKAAQTDLLAFTIDKTTGHFSPTTRYRDYAISREFVHWESQSTVRADSETGRRYQTHAAAGSHVLLFARHRADERAFILLGPATYVSHEGELPMAVTWRLQVPMPGDVFTALAAAVA